MSTKRIDYRTTSGQLAYQNIEQKKAELTRNIHKEHSNQRIDYNLIKNRESHFYEDFCTIYNWSCAYCGAKSGIIDSQLFEIDNYICQSAFPKSTEGRAKAGEVNNLVLACHDCNRRKSDFKLEGKYGILLNPDNNAIAKIFYRSDDYYIKVADEYKSNQIICQFYAQLNLGSELKRLDYLLLNVKELEDQQSEVNCIVSDKLDKIFSYLLKRRNASSYKLSTTN